jgi:hypothetical protein
VNICFLRLWNQKATYSIVNDCFISWKCFIVIYLQIHRHTNKISQFLHMIGLKLIKRFWVLVISPSGLKIDPGRCLESDITLARHTNRWGKTRFLLSYQICSFSSVTYNNKNGHPEESCFPECFIPGEATLLRLTIIDFYLLRWP